MPKDGNGEMFKELVGAKQTPNQIEGLKSSPVGNNVDNNIQIATKEGDTYLTEEDLAMADQFVQAEKKLEKGEIQGVKAEEAIRSIEEDISRTLGKNIEEIFTGIKKEKKPATDEEEDVEWIAG